MKSPFQKLLVSISMGLALFTSDVFGQQNSAGVKYELDSSGEVVGIHFWGSAEWLVKQESELAKWHNLPNLQSITISHTTVTEKQLDYISSLRNVTTLAIGPDWVDQEIEIPGSALAPLAKMHWLETLVLTDDGFSDEDYAFLSGLKSLRYLYIGGTIRQKTFDHISHLQDLDTFACQGIGFVSEESAKRFSELKNLKDVSLGNVSVKSQTVLANQLFKNTRLQHLKFLCNDITTDQLSNISKMTDLKRLDLSGLKSLRSLQLNNARDLEMLRIEVKGNELIQDFSFMEECSQLSFLSLSGVQLSPDAIKSLGRFDNIEYLALESVQLSDQLLTTLEDLPKLFYLCCKKSSADSVAKARQQLKNVRIEFSGN